MECEKVNMLDFVRGKNLRVIIPFYQRKYSWNTEKCERLYDDLKGVAKKREEAHFFGSLVYFPNNVREGFEERNVVDGQQRITTVMLLLMAIMDVSEELSLASDGDRLSRKTMEDEYFLSEWGDSFDGVKLWLGDEDRKAFESLFYREPGDLTDDGSAFVANYRFFRDAIRKDAAGDDGIVRSDWPGKLLGAVGRLETVSISLCPPADDPQLVFESLNSTGMALSEGDKVRNYVLMGLSVGIQREFYKKYWAEIEKLTDGDISGLVRDYLTVKKNSAPKTYEVYRDYKDYAEGLRRDDEPGECFSERLLKDLRRYAGYFGRCRGMGKGSVDRSLRRICRLGIGAVRPFLMKILSRLDETDESERIDGETARKVFETTENYLFRRSVCDYPSSALGRVFQAMDRNVMSFDLTTKDYAGKYVYILLKETDRKRGKFPRDDDFFKNFSESDMYHAHGACLYALERIEDFGVGDKESHFDDIYDKLDIGNRKEGYSVEHIMPQTLTDGWRRDLGDRHEEIHKTWLHRIANLTLTGYNPELKNYTFEQKKEIAYRSSGLKMTEKLCGYDAWGEEQLNERNAELLECAKKTWKLPETGFRPVSEDTFARTCGETEPRRFDRLCLFRYRLRGEKPADGGWDRMFEGVVKTLHGKDPTVLSSILSGTDCNEFPGKHVRSDESSFEHAVKIGDGLYIEKFSRASDMIWLLRDLLRRYGMNPSDLVFLVQDRKRRVERMCDTVEKKLEELRMEGTVRFDSGESSTGYTRFTTDFLDGFFPDAGKGDSSWREARDKHWFYEVVTDSGTEMFIKLTANFQNAEKRFVDFCKRLNGLCENEDLSYGKVWCILHYTKSIPIGEGFTDDDVREGLEKCLKEIFDNEPELERKKSSLTGAVAGEAGD